MNDSIWFHVRSVVESLRWQDLVDIALVYGIVYWVLLLIRGTRAVQVLTGLGVVSILYFISERFNLYTLGYLLKLFFQYLFLIIIILFQDEIRRALANIGRNPFLGGKTEKIKRALVVDEIVKAAHVLAAKRTGALIVIERQHGLKNFTEGATPIKADVGAELLVAIFQESSPIHDGAVVIQQDRILAAGVFFPLDFEAPTDRNFGTRHRAALSLTQETDALVIVVSEERGEISLVEGGEIKRDLVHSDLKERLYKLLDLEKTLEETSVSS